MHISALLAGIRILKILCILPLKVVESPEALPLSAKRELLTKPSKFKKL